MISRDRRFGARVPFETFLDLYIDERRHRALSANLSETGLHLCAASTSGLAAEHGKHLAIELHLPGMKESIWAAGEIRTSGDGGLVTTIGIRFTAMARSQARSLRDFCVARRREHLSGLLAAIRSPLGQLSPVPA